jgi:hypothetical protein
MIARISSRVLVGLPLCESFISLHGLVVPDLALGRDPDYNSMCIDFAMEVSSMSYLLSAFPPFLRP